MQNPAQIHEIAEERTRTALAVFDKMIDVGADFIHIVNDVAWNNGPFISPKHFREFITPYMDGHTYLN